jgi:hypothetical protein
MVGHERSSHPSHKESFFRRFLVEVSRGSYLHTARMFKNTFDFPGNLPLKYEELELFIHYLAHELAIQNPSFLNAEFPVLPTDYNQPDDDRMGCSAVIAFLVEPRLFWQEVEATVRQELKQNASYAVPVTDIVEGHAQEYDQLRAGLLHHLAHLFIQTYYNADFHTVEERNQAMGNLLPRFAKKLDQQEKKSK